jgi:hypothetical protein
MRRKKSKIEKIRKNNGKTKTERKKARKKSSKNDKSFEKF